MPIYEYRCDSNNRVVEVTHKMADRVRTWGELCERAGMSPGDTDATAPVTKLMSAGFVAVGGGEAAGELPACGDGMCGGGTCAID